jgi:hypothetical protein
MKTKLSIPSAPWMGKIWFCHKAEFHIWLWLGQDKIGWQLTKTNANSRSQFFAFDYKISHGIMSISLRTKSNRIKNYHRRLVFNAEKFNLYMILGDETWLFENGAVSTASNW